MDFAGCAADVDPILMQQVVKVESGGNPYAIGVVGARLQRQPKNLAEAVSTVKALEREGYNYSIGASQINKVHFARLGWLSAIATGFDVCSNLKAGSGVLKDCHTRAIRAGYPSNPPNGGYSAIHAALSCYYSGHFERGAQLGYVEKVLGATAKPLGIGKKKERLKSVATSMFID